MAIDDGKTELVAIRKSFTAEETAEYRRRERIVVVLLSRLSPICNEMGALIDDRNKDRNQSDLYYKGALAVAAVMGALIWLEILKFHVLIFPGVFIIWSIIRGVIFPSGINFHSILGLRQTVTQIIVRIEELGISETAVFLWVRKTAALKDEIIEEIREMYLATNHDSGADLSEIGVFLADDDGEYDEEVVMDKGPGVILTRIRVQLAKSVVADSNG